MESRQNGFRNYTGLNERGDSFGSLAHLASLALLAL